MGSEPQDSGVAPPSTHTTDVGRPNKRARRKGWNNASTDAPGSILSEAEVVLAEALTAAFGSEVSLEDMSVGAEAVFAILHA